jgi:hypothetical protein
MYSLVLAALLLLASASQAVQITGVQRGVQRGFELVIVHCDSLPDFRLDYDQIKGEFQLQLKSGRIRPQVAAALDHFLSGETISSARVDRKRSLITFRVKKSIFLREYLVTAPPALILDFSPGSDTSRRLPFELDREGYLKLGGHAEKQGRLDLALQYVDHVREWGESDPGLVHRAGVIEQRLGKWNLALEAFAKSSADPELAADAHARRTMIFMAQGDTLASGREWAGYFHRQPATNAPDTSQLAVAPKDTVGTANSIAMVESHPTVAQRSFQKKRFPLQLVAEAGGGDSTNYLYYGWGLLIVGLITLVGLWAGSSKVRKLADSEAHIYRPFEPARPQSEMEFLKEFKPVLPDLRPTEPTLSPDAPPEQVQMTQVAPLIPLVILPTTTPEFQTELPPVQAEVVPQITAETQPIAPAETPPVQIDTPQAPKAAALLIQTEILQANIATPPEAQEASAVQVAQEFPSPIPETSKNQPSKPEIPKAPNTPSADAATVTHFVRFNMSNTLPDSLQASTPANGKRVSGVELKHTKPLTKSTRIISASRDARGNVNSAVASPLQARVPTERIVSMADKGMDEESIARELGIGRDEVALAVNLSKSAR